MSITIKTNEFTYTQGQAIQKNLPKVVWLRCWNHTINAAKVWLKKHGATSQEVPIYVSHLRELLNQCSTSGYEEKLKQFEGLWSKLFYQYYMSNIGPEVNILLRH